MDLALQLTKEGKEALIDALEESIKEETPSTEDKNDFQFSTDTPNKLKSGESNPQPLTEEQIQQLQEENKEAWKNDDKIDKEWEQLMENHL